MTSILHTVYSVNTIIILSLQEDIIIRIVTEKTTHSWPAAESAKQICAYVLFASKG